MTLFHIETNMTKNVTIGLFIRKYFVKMILFLKLKLNLIWLEYDKRRNVVYEAYYVLKIRYIFQGFIIELNT